jgi:methylated-DNA-[protein]-cysteine S-methyltransferase
LTKLQQAGMPTPALDSRRSGHCALATAAGIAGLWFDARSATRCLWPPPWRPGAPAHRRAALAGRVLVGQDTSAITVPLDLHGTLFQRAVWQQLLRIPFGHTLTYGQVAAGVGNGAVPRATGSACGANPVGVIVPCHRVLGANGSLTGFAAGLPRKTALLQHEGALLT